MRKLFEVDAQTENRLRSLPLKPMPDGLREKILTAAKAERSSRAWTTPFLRAALTGTAAVLAAVVLFSALSDRSQTARLQALADGHRTVQAELEHAWALEMENLGDSLGPEELAREIRIRAYRRMALPPPAVRIDKKFNLEELNGQGISEDLN